MGENAPCKAMRILNRIVTLTPNGHTCEADPRHGEPLVRNLGLQKGHSVATPGIKESDATTQPAKDHETMVVTPRTELDSDNNTGDDDFGMGATDGYTTVGDTDGTTTANTATNTYTVTDTANNAFINDTNTMPLNTLFA